MVNLFKTKDLNTVKIAVCKKIYSEVGNVGRREREKREKGRRGGPGEKLSGGRLTPLHITSWTLPRS